MFTQIKGFIGLDLTWCVYTSLPVWSYSAEEEVKLS